MMELALKLVIAHIAGDFIFQPHSWVKDKIHKKHKSKYLYYHLLIHIVALLVVLKFDVQKYWPAIVLISFSHFIIDLIKLNFVKKINSIPLFVVDQLAHIAIIGITVYLYEPFQFNFEILYSADVLWLILSILLVTYVASVVIKLLMGKWILEDDTDESLENAGRYIGILERLFVFGFIILDQWEGIGLLIAAKSVFRFGDLTSAKDRKLTEYILIGTLLSFAIAVAIGIGYLRVVT